MAVCLSASDHKSRYVCQAGVLLLGQVEVWLASLADMSTWLCACAGVGCHPDCRLP